MTVRFRRSAGLVLGALLLLNTACYSYAPVATGVNVGAGTAVRVQLSAEGSQELAGSLGPGTVAAMGMLTERRSDGSVVVGVDAVERLGGARQSWSGVNVITLLPRQITSIDAKTLDKSKTRAAVIGSTLGIIAVFALALATGGVSGSPADGGTQPPP